MIGRVLSGASAALAGRWVYDRISVGASAKRWQRTNHRGETVTLAQGPSVSLGSLVGIATAPGLPVPLRAASTLAVGGASALGMLDDLTGATDVKGLRGHLGALRQGQVTTGSVKLVGLGVTGLVAGALARRGRGGPVDAVLAGAVIAGSANLANLFDLRPGRATKVFLAASAGPVLSGGAAGAVLAGPCWPRRLCFLKTSRSARCWETPGPMPWERPGVLRWRAPRAVGTLLATVAALVALTVASERVSFSQVIDRTPVLRELDGMGRRPSTPAGQ